MHMAVLGVLVYLTTKSVFFSLYSYLFMTSIHRWCWYLIHSIIFISIDRIHGAFYSHASPFIDNCILTRCAHSADRVPVQNAFFSILYIEWYVFDKKGTRFILFFLRRQIYAPVIIDIWRYPFFIYDNMIMNKNFFFVKDTLYLLSMRPYEIFYFQKWPNSMKKCILNCAYSGTLSTLCSQCVKTQMSIPLFQREYM